MKKEETKDPTRLNGGGKAVPRGAKEVTPEMTEKKGSERKASQKRGNSGSK